MGPARKRYWLPLVRLGAFFAAVVVSGNLLLHGIHASECAVPEVGGGSDTYGRKTKRLEKNMRAIRQMIQEPFSAPASPPPVAPVVEPGALLAPVEPPALAYFEPDVLPLFMWPDLPIASGPFDETFQTRKMLAEWAHATAHDPVADAFDILMIGPELLVDGAISLAYMCVPRSGKASWRVDDRESMTSRILDVQVSARAGWLSTSFMKNLIEREQHYFARFADTDLNTSGFQEGTEDVDMDDLRDAQQKILWDAAKRTYLSKYEFKAEQRIQDDSFNLNEWQGVDYVLVPPLMGAYFWWRGLDKKISIGDTMLRIYFEPIRDWADRDSDMVAGASLEWRLKSFPIGLIVTAGHYDSGMEIDFIGIGTSTEIVRRVLNAHHED